MRLKIDLDISKRTEPEKLRILHFETI